MVIDPSSIISGSRSVAPMPKVISGNLSESNVKTEKSQKPENKDAFIPKTITNAEVKIDTLARPEKPAKPVLENITFWDGIGIWNAPKTLEKSTNNKKALASYEKQKEDYNNKMELYLFKQMKKQGIDTNAINDGEKILRRPIKPEKPEIGILDGIGLWNAPRLLKEKNQYTTENAQYEKDIEAYLQGLEKHLERESKNKQT